MYKKSTNKKHLTNQLFNQEINTMSLEVMHETLTVFLKIITLSHFSQGSDFPKTILHNPATS